MNTDIQDTTSPEIDWHDTLEYRHTITQNLAELVTEYLTFSSTRDLVKLLAANL